MRTRVFFTVRSNANNKTYYMTDIFRSSTNCIVRAEVRFILGNKRFEDALIQDIISARRKLL